jgi:AcrR family transcriptional regulator
MARPRTPGRFDAVCSGALTVFGRVGFARAQMADIAKEAGVSTGTLYNYVDSKEALLLHSLERSMLDLPPPDDLPVTAPAWDEYLRRVESGLRKVVRIPTLEAALATEEAPASIDAELRAVLEELYDLIARTPRGAHARERSAVDVPALAELYFAGARRTLFEQFARYLHRRIGQGLLPPVPDLAATVRFVSESTTWFARHRHGDPAASEVSDDAARTNTVELLLRALLPARPLPTEEA